MARKKVSSDFLFKDDYVKEEDLKYFIQRSDVEKLVDTVLRIGKEDPNGFPAAKFILDRVLNPPRTGRPVPIKLPSLNTIKDVEKAYNLIIKEMGEGKISPEEANLIIKVIEHKKDTIVKRDLIDRHEKIEEFVKINHV